MSLNDTPSGERAHIAFFGVRNAGKSSLVNALTNQTVSVVSDVAGTTTDPVRKAMELAPAGPVLVIDTPGIDDAGDVGDLRVQRAETALNEADVAVLVVDATRGMTSFDDRLLATFQTRRIPTSSPKTRPTCLRKAGVLAPQSRRCLRRPWGQTLRMAKPSWKAAATTPWPPPKTTALPHGPSACAYRRERARAWTT